MSSRFIEGVSAASGLDLKELAQHEPHLLSTDKTKPFIYSVGVGVIILCIEQDAQHLLVLEEVYRLCHQARSDTPAPERWMASDPHEVAGFAVQRIKLVSYHLAI